MGSITKFSTINVVQYNYPESIPACVSTTRMLQAGSGDHVNKQQTFFHTIEYRGCMITKLRRDSHLYIHAPFPPWLPGCEPKLPRPVDGLIVDCISKFRSESLPVYNSRGWSAGRFRSDQDWVPDKQLGIIYIAGIIMYHTGIEILRHGGCCPLAVEAVALQTRSPRSLIYSDTYFYIQAIELQCVHTCTSTTVQYTYVIYLRCYSFKFAKLNYINHCQVADFRRKHDIPMSLNCLVTPDVVGVYRSICSDNNFSQSQAMSS